MPSLFEDWFGRKADAVPLTMYSRPGCHLCDLMKAEVARARVARPYRWIEIDIDTDPELAARYGHSIPVLAIGGHVAFKLKLTAPEFERKFARWAEVWADEWARARGQTSETRSGGEQD